MRASRAVIVVGGSAAIITTGFIQAPKHALEAGLGEATAAGDVFTGPDVVNLRGHYQLQIVVSGGQVVDVVFVHAGTLAAESVAVNAFALPALRERILAAQSWDVDYVSGSSYTSPAMIESAKGAFADAGLG